MLGLCEITSCRRQALLRYFGESPEQPCGNCDTCLTPVQTWDGTEAARKALSCVFRTGQRFGVAHLIDVLLGKSTAKVQQFEHQALSTFGIGKDLDQNMWRSVYRQLVARAYLSVDMEAYGAIKLSEQCRGLLRGEESIELRRDVGESRERKANKKASNKFNFKADDQALWDALRETRKALADEQGVPPYVIFHDATLMEMVNFRPATEDAMLRLSGIGQSKLEHYGEAFLKVIATHEEENPPQQQDSDTLLETLALLQANMTVEQISTQRSIAEDTVYKHIATLLQDRRIALQQALDIAPADLALIQDQILTHDNSEEGFRFKPVFEALDGLFDYGLLRCVRVAMLTENQ